MKQFGKYFLAWLLFTWGCNGDEPSKQFNGPAYFPLQTGFYQIYTVEKNTYSEVNPDEFLEYELKTEVVDSISNLEGGYTFVIYRSTRPTENDSWEFLDTWSAYIDEEQVVVKEGNIPYVQLMFPIFKNREWNSNELNSGEEDLYKIQSIGKTYELETGAEFSKSLIVDQEHTLSFLLRDEREEVYAPSVGLIYKKSVIINYCDDGNNPDCLGQQIIKDGVEYFQVLKSYGQN